MKRVRVQSYKVSKSARLLSKYLGVKRLKVTGSRFRGKTGDIIINWGNIPNERVHHRATYLNDRDGVVNAANKLSTFYKMSINQVPTPYFTTSWDNLESDKQYVARMTLYGHSGEGIVAGTKAELPMNAPLYTEFIDKKAEYRVIVVGDRAVDVKIKKKKRDYDDDRDPYVWNHSNGYVFARDCGVFNTNVTDIGIKAVASLGLTYGAVDIIEDSSNNLYVLEVNTAFGLEGTTTELVGDAIKALLWDKGVRL